MAYERTYDVMLNVSERTRKRLELVKTIIRLQQSGLTQATWSNAVEWLVETVPIPELLASLCSEVDQTAPQGD